MAIPIGLQLYSVRKECEKDLPAVLDAVAKMGYAGVEFAGYYGRTAKDLRRMLDDRDLACCGTHTGLDTLLGDKFQETVAFNQALGNRFLVVPWLAEERRNSRKAWLETARLFADLAAKARPHGMLVGYHNHHIEFTPMDGEVPWDTFFGNTPQDVVMQFDTGNAAQGGGDAALFLTKYPGRALTVHVKPWSRTNPKAVLGEDDLAWDAIFRLCETVGKTEWYIVEYEVEGVPALEAVEKCLKAMRAMGR